MACCYSSLRHTNIFFFYCVRRKKMLNEKNSDKSSTEQQMTAPTFFQVSSIQGLGKTCSLGYQFKSGLPLMPAPNDLDYNPLCPKIRISVIKSYHMHSQNMWPLLKRHLIGSRAEIHESQITQFYLQVKFFSVKLPVKN